jgi:hypothetical protein
MQTFTFGTTPESVIRSAFERETPDGFSIDVQGWDSETLDVIGYGSGTYSVDQLIALLDALRDYPVADYRVLSDYARSLRASILESLGIEEI